MSSDRQTLTRERILDAAIAMVDEEGLNALTMRRLGGSLGVEAMSLYRYVPSRDHLLDGMVSRMFATLSVDRTILGGADFGWQEYLQRLAHGVRAVALAHPKVFPLVMSRPPEAPWLRPPLRDLHLVEAFLRVLRESDFTDERAVVAYRAYTSFLLGMLLLEVAGLGAELTPIDEDEQDSDESTDTLAEYPNLRKLGRYLMQNHSVEEFEESLEHLLQRLHDL